MGLLSALFGPRDDPDPGKEQREEQRNARRSGRDRDRVEELIFMDEILDD